MSIVYKTYTSILHSRLSTWAETNNILPRSQRGFRKNKSTTSAVSALMNKINLSVNENKFYYVAFIDFKKAFDCVDRCLLLNKLLTFGVSYRFIKVLYSILQSSFVKVTLGEYVTESIQQFRGVPQGDKLSPHLFSLFISDLSAELERADCDVVFYADDLAIGSSFREDLQFALYRLAAYCETNRLEVNVKKCELMKF